MNLKCEVLPFFICNGQTKVVVINEQNLIGVGMGCVTERHSIASLVSGHHPETYRHGFEAGHTPDDYVIGRSNFGKTQAVICNTQCNATTVWRQISTIATTRTAALESSISAISTWLLATRSKTSGLCIRSGILYF